MAPVMQCVFAEMPGISEHFTAGSHEWLPYSGFSTLPKQICKHQLIKRRKPGKHITANREVLTARDFRI